jgi:hypothetical protein
VLAGWPEFGVSFMSRVLSESDDDLLDTTRVKGGLVDRLRNHSGGKCSKLGFGKIGTGCACCWRRRLRTDLVDSLKTSRIVSRHDLGNVLVLYLSGNGAKPNQSATPDEQTGEIGGE